MKDPNHASGPAHRLLRVLLVEDDPSDVDLVVALLKRAGFPLTFDAVDQRADFQQVLNRGDCDIILCDHNLRDWNGLDALEMLKESKKDIPFIVVTAVLGDEAAVEYIKQGAADYVLKHRLERLPVAVRQALRDRAHREESGRLLEQIQAGKREWELTFDSVPAPILLLNLNGEIVRANHALVELAGKKFSEIIGRPCWETLKCHEQGSAQCPHRETLETGRFSRREELVRVSGFLFECSASPLRDPAGNLSGTIVVLHDLTERRRAEDALRESEERFRTAFRASPEPMTIRRLADGCYLDVNDAFLRAMGLRREEVVGRPAGTLGIWADPHQRDRLVQELQAGREIRDWEVQIRPKTGEDCWYLLSAALIEVSGESCMILMARDVTARKRAESQLAEQLEELRRWHQATLHREDRILDLNHLVNELWRPAGQPPRYSSAESESGSRRQ